MEAGISFYAIQIYRTEALDYGTANSLGSFGQCEDIDQVIVVLTKTWPHVDKDAA